MLYAESKLCNFKSAERTFVQITNILKTLTAEEVSKGLLSTVYIVFSEMYFARSEYDYSYMWSSLAIRYLDESVPERYVL